MAEKPIVVEGKNLVYLFRVEKNKAKKTGLVLAYTTENERTKSKDSDSVATKDGTITTPGVIEQEITATAFLTTSEQIDEIEEAFDNSELMEIWEANLQRPDEEGKKYKGHYFQGYITEMSYTSAAEDKAEVALTFAINGEGEPGDVTVTKEQQEAAKYAFKDTVVDSGAEA